MIRIPLYDKHVYDDCEKCFLEIYCQQRSRELSERRRPAVIVFPGGGYAFTSDREAEPVANLFLSGGFPVFVVRYTLAPNCHVINPLIDAARAVSYVREHAEEYLVDPDKIAVCGFSAGGHLAAYISTCFDDERVCSALGITPEDAKPNASILGYAVISGIRNINLQTITNILSDSNPSDEDKKLVSLELKVKDNTPPAFIWATSNDTCVPVFNSLAYADALAEHNIPFEMHVFPLGGHGLSVATRETQPDWDTDGRYDAPYVARWGQWAVKWLDSTFYSPDYKN